MANTNDVTEEEISRAVQFLRDMMDKKEGGEHRPHQEVALRAVEHAISKRENLLLEAGTGVGKSFALAIPAMLSGQKITYSTATKQLSEQVMQDLKILQKIYREVTGKHFNYTLLKGRDNYLCLKKLDMLHSLSSQAPDLFTDDEGNSTIKEPTTESGINAQKIYTWAEETKTGDRGDAPSVTDELWKTFSSNSKECVGKSKCPFGDTCFAELARNKAQTHDILVTNHAITAIDLASEDSSLMGNRDVIIVDEMHEFEDSVSNAWGSELHSGSIAEYIVALRRVNFPEHQQASKDAINEKLVSLSEEYQPLLAQQQLKRLPPDSTPDSIRIFLTELKNQISRAAMLLDGMSDEAASIADKTGEELLTPIYLLLEENRDYVRSIDGGKDDDANVPRYLAAAPIRVGPKLMEVLGEKDSILIAASATVTVAGKFEIPVRNFALDEEISPFPYKTLNAGTPFNYDQQGMLFLAGADAPSFNSKNRRPHEEYVEEYSTKFIDAMGGRSLMLTSTSRRTEALAAHYRKKFGKKRFRIISQGDGSVGQVIQEFIDDEESVLVGTLGFWHGLNAVGATNSLTMMDLVPFAPPGNALLEARIDDAKSRGRNGFMDISVAKANVKLAQGAGRLIRSQKDRGVVAIFDNKLTTARYGSAMLKSLPPMRRFQDPEVIINSLNNLRKSLEG